MAGITEIASDLEGLAIYYSESAMLTSQGHCTWCILTLIN
jgi:myo-inositol-hexaphosphate 3-phosphohydrolase